MSKGLLMVFLFWIADSSESINAVLIIKSVDLS